MNFANITNIRIPQGEVIQIQDSLSRILWKKSSPYSTPFYVENTSNTSHTLTVKMSREQSTKHPTGRFTFSYATNIGSWTDVTLNIDYTGGGVKEWSQSIPAHSRIYFASNESRWYWYDSSYNLWMKVGFGSDDNTGSFKLGGNIMSLVYGTSFAGDEVTLPAARTFEELFYDFDLLTDASELLLPATTLTMSCYIDMFNGCTSLISAPELPAPILNNSCYLRMFNGCTSLNNIKCLATDISANNCLFIWVGGVSQTGTFTKKAGITYPSGASGIPSGWTVVEV